MLQFLLSDNESLLQYLNEEYVSIEEIKMRLFLKKRAQNFLLPDHLYRLEQTIVFDTTKSLSVLFTATMPDFVSSYLELENNRIYIRQEKHNDWQEILTFIPPLWLQSLLLFKKTNDKFSLEDRVKYFNTYIVPNTQYTSIPSAKIPHLNYFIAENKGLHDLHMHLNGALETDQVWQDYLFNPKEVYYHLKKGYKSTKVKEQLEQESVQFTPLNYYKLLKIAQRLRELFYVFLFPDEAAIYKEKNKMVLLQKLVNDFSSYPGNYQHPFRALVCTSIQRHPNEMSIEALMHIMILDRLQNNPNEILAGLLHFYLLI